MEIWIFVSSYLCQDNQQQTRARPQYQGEVPWVPADQQDFLELSRPEALPVRVRHNAASLADLWLPIPLQDRVFVPVNTTRLVWQRSNTPGGLEFMGLRTLPQTKTHILV